MIILLLNGGNMVGSCRLRGQRQERSARKGLLLLMPNGVSRVRLGEKESKNKVSLCKNLFQLVCRTFATLYLYQNYLTNTNHWAFPLYLYHIPQYGKKESNLVYL